MKFCIILWISLLSLILPDIGYSSMTPYCKGTQVSSAEDGVIQRLVARFGNEMKCEIGDHCLLKWAEQDNTEKFSIAWKKQCGPIIHGVHQLGDDGHGSTFLCQRGDKNSICCWPLGYHRLKQFTICSDTL